MLSLDWIFTMINTPAYRIIAIDEDYEDCKKIFAKVQVIGTSNIFKRAISELYQKEWLDCFSKEDVAHIAALYTAEHTNNFKLISQFPKRNIGLKPSVYIVGLLFSAFLILSNLTAVKLAALGEFIFPSALIFFPLTYVFDDILTEVYGFKISRRIIWAGLFANLIIFTGTYATTYLPAANDWPHELAYETIYRATPRIFFASTLGYFFGEFANSIVLAKLKILTSGKYLWLRAITSSVIGISIDTVFFVHAAFLFTVPYFMLWKIISTAYFVKILYEICALPLTYKITEYLKRKDKIDHYDYQTNFNPFSLEV